MLVASVNRRWSARSWPRSQVRDLYNSFGSVGLASDVHTYSNRLIGRAELQLWNTVSFLRLTYGSRAAFDCHVFSAVFYAVQYILRHHGPNMHDGFKFASAY